MSNASRPPIRVRLRINIDTGEIEFIIDDSSPDRSEDYHNRIAHAIASFLDRNPEIRDAGPMRYRLDQEWYALTDAHERTARQDRRDTQAE
ncbi:MAG TPA: hypothetical protein VGN34_25080 [Ktedonobacteraceae bacterium]|jgi:hypothetical protein